MKIIVTGGRGFLGAHVVRELRARGAEVLALGRKDCDLRSFTETQTILQTADQVVHLAADVGGVGYLRNSSARIYHDNLQMGLNVVQAACLGSATRVVIASTPCCYAADADLPLNENALRVGIPSGDTAAYAFSKLGTSAIANSLCSAAGKDCVSFIPSNLYGPGDTFSPHRSHVAAALIRKALVAAERGESRFDVWGDGSATRDFVYVEDVASAVAEMTLATKSYHGSVYNLGSGIETAIREIAEVVANCTGAAIKPSFSPAKPVGYSRRVLDIQKAKRDLGFNPSTPLNDGVDRTIAWIKDTGLLKEMLAD